MFLFILAFLSGDVFLQSFSLLPPNKWLWVVLIISFASWRCFRNRFTLLMLGFVLGFCWTSWYASNQLSWNLPAENENRPIEIVGYVASLPVKNVKQTSFMFSLEQLNKKPLTENVHIRLTWQHPLPSISVGDKWHLRVKLKRIHSVQNPGSFDMDAWALQKGLRAQGSVLPDKQHYFILHDRWRYPVEQFRQRLQERIQTILPKTNTAHWLMTLMIGERGEVVQQDWQVLRNTGTNHLMAIAGLHIGMIAVLVYVVTKWLWRRSSYLMLRMPAQQASVIASLIVAILYSAIAGFSLPTQRASLMLVLLSCLFLMKRQINIWHVWSLACWCVLLINPLATLSESFWLSFGTIALIIYGMSGRLSPKGWWWKWGRVQWVIAVGLTPFSLLFFQECSLNSFIANAIAIPWLEFLILPFCFVSTILLFISPLAAKIILYIAAKSMAGLWLTLSWFAHSNYAIWSHAIPNHWVFLSAIIGLIILLLPNGVPGRWLGIIWLLPLFFYQPAKPKNGEVWMTMLDVGQGLSLVVQTATHLLVYDAGMKLSDNADMGERVVVPYLRTLGAKKIDMLVVSHGDNDHMGGVESILRHYPITTIKTSVPEKLSLPTSNYCLAEFHWQWDDVSFSFIHPSKEDIGTGNNSSCVLRIEQRHHTALLTGDIEKLAEEKLLAHSLAKLPATILIAPHHGSKTSGVQEFIRAVNPQYVLYSTGYRNRYHFPHPSIIQIYQAYGVKQLNTAQDGAIILHLNQNELSIDLYRKNKQRFWLN